MIFREPQSVTQQLLEIELVRESLQGAGHVCGRPRSAGGSGGPTRYGRDRARNSTSRGASA
ncbi:MAG: Transcriptional regulator, LysR family [uncultured Paraburkholderia sp.]|nr:MAG: Transcriptional regulator, LysR family [uncultured Paraburkholderia sp.]